MSAPKLRAATAHAGLDLAGEMLVEPLAGLGRGGGREAGAVALGLGGEGELANDERRAARVEERAVHPPLVVAEDAQVRRLAREPRALRLGVAAHRADEDDEARSDLADDLAADGDARAGVRWIERAHAQRVT